MLRGDKDTDMSVGVSYYYPMPVAWTPTIVVQTHYERDVYDSIARTDGGIMLNAWQGSHISIDTYYAKTPWGLASQTIWHVSDFSGFSISGPDFYIGGGRSESRSGSFFHQEEVGFNWPVMLASEKGSGPDAMGSSPYPYVPAGNIVTDSSHLESHVMDWSAVQQGQHSSYSSRSTDVYLDEFHQRGPGYQIDSQGSVVNNNSYLHIADQNGSVTVEHYDHTAQSSYVTVQQATPVPSYDLG